MEIEDFTYDLPEGLIAQNPLPERTASRLLKLLPDGIEHGTFTGIVDLLQPGDLLVLNDTRVLNARLHGIKDSGGGAEILLERVLGTHEALCQVRVSKPLKAGRTIRVGDVELTSAGREGQFYKLQFGQPVMDVLEEHGHVPLPPYIDREDEAFDHERYQTVFATQPGSVAAPTAGLHLDEALLRQLEAGGIRTARVTLHVGAGTFQPVRGSVVEHKMHQEWYEVPEDTARAIKRTKQTGGRVVALGTTVVRTLEAVAEKTGQVRPGAGETALFIVPGFKFQVVDALITNFHLPRSTLLMLVCAFAGTARVLEAYATAVNERYRFFSYGDAMWLERADV